MFQHNFVSAHEYRCTFLQIFIDDIFLNDTAELEQRVEDLEVAMVTVQNDVSELETEVSLINENLINIETDVSDNRKRNIK